MSFQFWAGLACGIVVGLGIGVMLVFWLSKHFSYG